MAHYEIQPVSFDIPGAVLATGLSESALRRYVQAGDIAVRYAGTKPLIERDELAAFVAALPSTKE